VSVLSSLASEKSGAESPIFKLPARALVHKVSNGTTRKTSHGMCDITRAKSSGGSCMACHMKVTKANHRTKTLVRIAAVIFFQRRFLAGTGVMVEELLIFVSLTAPTSPELRNVVARANLFNNAKRLVTGEFYIEARNLACAFCL
jgi:hypothetical protein